MVSLTKYAAASLVAAGAIVYHAYQTREQFYPAMLYLATSKTSFLILGNLALVLTILFGQLLKAAFLGQLREAEVERLYELSRHEIMETCLAMTIFRDEFNASFAAMFTALLFVKIFHWLTQKRVEYIETTPSVSVLSHARIITLLALLLAVDVFFLQYAVTHTLTTGPSVLLLFAFEYVILASSVVATFLKYGLYTADVAMEGQWDNKAVYVFYLELFRDLLHLFVYLVFFLIIFIYYGLPLHLVRDLYETFRNFKARVADFLRYRRYRRLTSNMNDRFVDATAEELGRGDATCIICREEMTTAKKLPCGHLFHIQCLRSWLERQQTCPTCRAPVVPAEPQDVSRQAAGQAAERAQVQAVQAQVLQQVQQLQQVLAQAAAAEQNGPVRPGLSPVQPLAAAGAPAHSGRSGGDTLPGQGAPGMPMAGYYAPWQAGAIPWYSYYYPQANTLQGLQPSFVAYAPGHGRSGASASSMPGSGSAALPTEPPGTSHVSGAAGTPSAPAAAFSAVPLLEMYQAQLRHQMELVEMQLQAFRDLEGRYPRGGAQEVQGGLQRATGSRPANSSERDGAPTPTLPATGPVGGSSSPDVVARVRSEAGESSQVSRELDERPGNTGQSSTPQGGDENQGIAGGAQHGAGL